MVMSVFRELEMEPIFVEEKVCLLHSVTAIWDFGNAVWPQQGVWQQNRRKKKKGQVEVSHNHHAMLPADTANI